MTFPAQLSGAALGGHNLKAVDSHALALTISQSSLYLDESRNAILYYSSSLITYLEEPMLATSALAGALAAVFGPYSMVEVMNQF